MTVREWNRRSQITGKKRQHTSVSDPHVETTWIQSYKQCMMIYKKLGQKVKRT